MTDQLRRLHRSRKERLIGGVCGGVAEHLNLDPNLVRLATVFLTCVTGILPLLITYIVALLILPEE